MARPHWEDRTSPIAKNDSILVLLLLLDTSLLTPQSQVFIIIVTEPEDPRGRRPDVSYIFPTNNQALCGRHDLGTRHELYGKMKR